MRSPSPVPVSDQSANPKARQGIGCLFAFCGLFFVVGFVVFIFTFVRPALQIVAARNWGATSCQITTSSLITGRDSDGDRTYTADVGYSYTWKGTNHAGNRILFGAKSNSYNSQQAIIAQYPVGSTTTCYVNPADPAESVLNRAPTSALWFGLMPLIFCAFGAGVPLLASRGMKNSRRPTSNWQAKTPAVSSEGTFLSPHAAALSGTVGPVVLKPKSTPTARATGLGCFAVFWNGFVGFFLFSMLKDGFSGFQIFPLLFMIPFVLIGLFMLGAWISSTLAIFNAQATVTLSRPFLRPGESAEIGWKLSGGKKPERVQVWLEGREEAIYERGTDTLTDKSLFFREDLADTTTEIMAGQATLKLPLDTMHSLEAPHNKIIWTLTLLGHVARFPDVREEFVILVEPRS